MSDLVGGFRDPEHGRQRTTLSGTFRRLLKEIPELEELYHEARLTLIDVPVCRQVVWMVRFEDRVKELAGFYSGRNRDAWACGDPETSPGIRLDGAEFDVVYETFLSVMTPCPPDCRCRDALSEVGPKWWEWHVGEEDPNRRDTASRYIKRQIEAARDRYGDDGEGDDG